MWCRCNILRLVYFLKALSNRVQSIAGLSSAIGPFRWRTCLWFARRTSAQHSPTLSLFAVSLVLTFTSTAEFAQTQSNANAAAELRRAAELLQSGKIDEAEPVLRHVLASDPKNADAHNLLGIVFDQRSKTGEAEREYRMALRFNPNSLSAMANLGVLLARTHREGEAIKMFESVLHTAPEHPQATINL